jgi:hypothetical protein
LSFTPDHHFGHFGEEHNVEAQNIHDDFHLHEEGSSQSYREKTAKSEETNAVEIGLPVEN